MTRIATAAFAVCAFSASTSDSAVLPVSGTVLIEIMAAPSPSLIGSGSGDSVPGAIASHPAFTVPVTHPILPSFLGLGKFTIPGASLPAGGGGGVNGLAGSAFLFAKAGTPAGTIPLGPVGGGSTAPFIIGRFEGTVLGATWQDAAGTGSPVVFSTMAVVLAIPITATATAYDNRAADGRGVVQFVAPATGEFGVIGSFPIYGVLTLTYTPEPGTILLLGVGIAWLGALGRGKQRA